eukprot:TRINITY_DN23130_c0_g1_i1.p1 TRINITY_DN23130_c0_g1~~TRINITY_DN23130_c0_g1_i1.p1  ORF type:complete len:285 (+),score=54.27 TRINITY_DN23130_c0_g1_i1:54-857(+)
MAVVAGGLCRLCDAYDSQLVRVGVFDEKMELWRCTQVESSKPINVHPANIVEVYTPAGIYTGALCRVVGLSACAQLNEVLVHVITFCEDSLRWLCSLASTGKPIPLYAKNLRVLPSIAASKSKAKTLDSSPLAATTSSFASASSPSAASAFSARPGEARSAKALKKARAATAEARQRARLAEAKAARAKAALASLRKAVKASKKKAAPTAKKRQAEEELPECKICMEAAVDAVLTPCGHTMCSGCGSGCVACPMCRDVVRGLQKLYF